MSRTRFSRRPVGAERKIMALERQVTALRRDLARAQYGNLTESEFSRLVAWMRNPLRPLAVTEFTAGACRDAARAFELAQEFTREGPK